MNTIYIVQKVSRSGSVQQPVNEGYFTNKQDAERRIAEFVEAERVEFESIRERNLQSFSTERATRSGSFNRFVDHLLGVDTPEQGLLTPFDVEAATKLYRVTAFNPATKA